jgi:hypothetical protein
MKTADHKIVRQNGWQYKIPIYGRMHFFQEYTKGIAYFYRRQNFEYKKTITVQLAANNKCSTNSTPASPKTATTDNTTTKKRLCILNRQYRGSKRSCLQFFFGFILQSILYNDLKSVFYICSFFGGCFKVRDVTFWGAPSLCLLLRDLRWQYSTPLAVHDLQIISLEDN